MKDDSTVPSHQQSDSVTPPSADPEQDGIDTQEIRRTEQPPAPTGRRRLANIGCVAAVWVALSLVGLVVLLLGYGMIRYNFSLLTESEVRQVAAKEGPEMSKIIPALLQAGHFEYWTHELDVRPGKSGKFTVRLMAKVWDPRSMFPIGPMRSTGLMHLHYDRNGRLTNLTSESANP